MPIMFVLEWSEFKRRRDRIRNKDADTPLRYIAKKNGVEIFIVDFDGVMLMTSLTLKDILRDYRSIENFYQEELFSSSALKAATPAMEYVY